MHNLYNINDFIGKRFGNLTVISEAKPIKEGRTTFNQDKIFLGHYHTCVSIPAATVNGSVIGYNAFALTNGMGYEEPAQMYEVFDSEIGQLLSRKIYCK